MIDNPAPSDRPPLATVALLSAAMLSYEVLLMRIFSIIQWHHFAYMIISLALLGYGVSGTFISVFGRILQRRFRLALVANISLFAVTSWSALMLVQRLPFNPEELLWHWGQLGVAVLVYLLLAVPFFFAANGIVLVLSHYRARLPRIYGWDLLGAGVGALAVIGLLFMRPPARALELVALAAVLAAMAALVELRVRSMAAWLALSLLGLVFVFMPAGLSSLQISPYKSLSQTLQVKGSRVERELSSPLGLLTVVSSEAVPLRHAPGLSLMASHEPPEQLALFFDGDGMAAINRATENPQRLEFLTRSTAALPFSLRPLNRVLLVGMNGGTELLRAQQFGVPLIEIVELNPQVVELVGNHYRDYTGGLLDDARVNIHVKDARGFLNATDQRFDLIQFSTPGGFGAALAGLYTLNEDFLLTVEALQLYLRHLTPGGYLAFNLWAKVPPRDTLKLIATAGAALQRHGVADPKRALALIRSWQTTALVVKNGVFSGPEMVALRSFTRANGFDLAYYPGITRAEVNLRNQLAEPAFYQGATALLGPEAQAFMDAYKFMIEPATDQRPYFFNFFKWGTLSEVLGARGRGGMALLEAGYLVLIGTLAQALVASILLILLPLKIVRAAARPATAPRLTPTFLGVAGIGLGFMFIEITFIQRFTLLLSHPLYAVITALTGFLIFAGIGSMTAHRLLQRESPAQLVSVVVPLLVLVGLLALLAVEALTAVAGSWAVGWQITLAMLIVAPLAFLMGMPLPTMLWAVGEAALPWAWGVNGCASVVGAVLATLLAVHFGSSSVILLALGLYWLAGSAFTGRPVPRLRRHPAS